MQSIYFDFLNKTKNEHRCSTILRYTQDYRLHILQINKSVTLPYLE